MDLHTTGQRVRYRDKSGFTRLMMGFLLVVLAFALSWVNVGFRYSSTASTYTARMTFLFMLVVGLILLAGSLLMLILMLQTPLVFTPAALVIHRGFRTVSIPVQDIAGAGLVFKRRNPADLAPRGGAAWQLLVWRSDGRSEHTGIVYAPFTLSRKGNPVPGTRRSFGAATLDPVTGTHPGRLAASYAARVARDLYDRVLSCQGPSGRLAAQQLQNRVAAAGPWDGLQAMAYWSPDGVLGRAGEAHVQVRPHAGESEPDELPS